MNNSDGFLSFVLRASFITDTGTRPVLNSYYLLLFD